jgi:hypothetical protein
MQIREDENVRIHNEEGAAMNKKKFSLLLIGIILLAVVGAANFAQALELGARGYYWFPAFSATQRVDTASTTGTQFDIKNVMGVSNESFWSAEIYGGIGKHHLSAMYTPMKYTSNTNLTTPINFGGTNFTANTGVNYNLDFYMMDVKYLYDIINMENILAGFSVGPMVQVKYVSGSTELKSSGQDVKQNFSAPIPMVGLGAHIGLIANILEARAQVTGMGYSGNFVIEAMADISVTPFPFVDIHGGYKYIGLKVDRNDYYMDATFSGPFVALTVGF